MNDSFKNRGFTDEYMRYCAEHGCEGDPQRMLAVDKLKYPPNSKKYTWGSATGFMVWRGEQVSSGGHIAVEPEPIKVNVRSDDEKQFRKPVQQSLFDLLQ